MLDQTEQVSTRTTSDAQGRFHFGTAPSAAGLVLAVSAEGFENVSQPAPRRARDDLRIELTPTAATPAPSVVGVVRLPNGRAAVRAVVRAGWQSTVTDADAGSSDE